MKSVRGSHDAAHAVAHADIAADAGLKVPRRVGGLLVFQSQFGVPRSTVERSGTQVDPVGSARGFAVELVFQSRPQVPLESFVFSEGPAQARA